MWRALLALQTPIAVRAVVFAGIGASGRSVENLFAKSSPSATRPTANFGREGTHLIQWRPIVSRSHSSFVPEAAFMRGARRRQQPIPDARPRRATAGDRRPEVRASPRRNHVALARHLVELGCQPPGSSPRTRAREPDAPPTIGFLRLSQSLSSQVVEGVLQFEDLPVGSGQLRRRGALE